MLHESRTAEACLEEHIRTKRTPFPSSMPSPLKAYTIQAAKKKYLQGDMGRIVLSQVHLLKKVLTPNTLELIVFEARVFKWIIKLKKVIRIDPNPIFLVIL